MKIAICGLVKSSNLGEQFIAKSLSWIIRDELQKAGYTEEISFVEVDILGTNDDVHNYPNIIKSRLHNLYSYTFWGIPADVIHYKLKELARVNRSQARNNRVYKVRHYLWKHSRNLGKRIQRYLAYKFQDVDFIAIDGAGLLEYSYNAYQEPLALICDFADKKRIPVIFNAIGRAGEFDKNDFRCQILMSAFQYDSVKYVSARDSQESVQECVGERFNVKLLADAAFCVDDAFGINSMPRNKVIGIGLIRGDASLSYSKGFEEEDWINLFANIAIGLKKEGYEYEFFTNGMGSDYALGLKVLKKLGITSEKLVERPKRAEELLKTISSYEAIITCRMHSSIAAFAMGIPSVILSWNNKVDKYMDIIGYPERAISQSDFEANVIIDRLKNAINEGIDEEKRIKMKKLAHESVRDYVPLLLRL